jgi:hypothetical protein
VRELGREGLTGCNVVKSRRFYRVKDHTGDKELSIAADSFVAESITTVVLSTQVSTPGNVGRRAASQVDPQEAAIASTLHQRHEPFEQSIIICVPDPPRSKVGPIRAGDRIDAALSHVKDLEKGFTLFASHNGRIGLAYENLVAPVVIQVDGEWRLGYQVSSHSVLPQQRATGPVKRSNGRADPLGKHPQLFDRDDIQVTIAVEITNRWARLGLLPVGGVKAPQGLHGTTGEDDKAAIERDRDQFRLSITIQIRE